MTHPGHFAFVLPRFAEGIVGGAETLMGHLARCLSARGDHVEVFTTCARDNRSWANHYSPGSSIEFGVPTERFPVDSRDLEKWIPHQIAISQGYTLTLDQQFEWLENGVNSRALYETLARRRDEFEFVFLGPYLFSTTFFAALTVPDRAVLIPCLHDEEYAYLSSTASLFRQCRGALFNSAPERDLAERLYGTVRGGVVGMGFEPPAPERVAQTRPYFNDGAPYLLYLGRKETGKNAHLLIDWFLHLSEEKWARDLRLVIAGGGSFADLLRPRAADHPRIIDLVEVSEAEKAALLNHATALVQLSLNESFSIVLFEAWGYQTPVIVHAHCPVTRSFTEQADGGLFSASAPEFAGVVRHLLENPDIRSALGRQGRDFTEREFSWGSVLRRFDTALAHFRAEGGLDRTQSAAL